MSERHAASSKVSGTTTCGRHRCEPHLPVGLERHVLSKVSLVDLEDLVIVTARGLDVAPEGSKQERSNRRRLELVPEARPEAITTTSCIDCLKTKGKEKQRESCECRCSAHSGKLAVLGEH